MTDSPDNETSPTSLVGSVWEDELENMIYGARRSRTPLPGENATNLQPEVGSIEYYQQQLPTILSRPEQLFEVVQPVVDKQDLVTASGAVNQQHYKRNGYDVFVQFDEQGRILFDQLVSNDGNITEIQRTYDNQGYIQELAAVGVTSQEPRAVVYTFNPLTTPEGQTLSRSEGYEVLAGFRPLDRKDKGAVRPGESYFTTPDAEVLKQQQHWEVRNPLQ